MSEGLMPQTLVNWSHFGVVCFPTEAGIVFFTWNVAMSADYCEYTESFLRTTHLQMVKI